MSLPLAVKAGPELRPDNLAHQWLQREGWSLIRWWGMCYELSVQVVREHGGERVQIRRTDGEYLEGLGGAKWHTHVVPVVDGIVHDAWASFAPCPIVDYLRQAFPDQEVLCADLPVEDYTCIPLGLRA